MSQETAQESERRCKEIVELSREIRGMADQSYLPLEDRINNYRKARELHGQASEKLRDYIGFLSDIGRNSSAEAFYRQAKNALEAADQQLRENIKEDLFDIHGIGDEQ